jgi:CHAT domain-containing protein/Tfp pilus assembly protein PilF
MHRAPRLAIAIGALLALCTTVPHAQSTVLLRPGSPTARSLSAGAVHAYELRLAAGDFVHIVITKHDVDLSATLLDPDGHETTSRHSDLGEFTDEVVVAIAAADGRHELRIRSLSPTRASSRYSIEVVALRPAGPQDHDRVEAEAAIQRAASLQATLQPRAFASAQDEFTAALNIFRRLGDRRRELRALVGIASTQWGLGSPAALETARQAELQAVDLGDEPSRAAAIHIKGAALERLGELDAAMRAHEASSTISRQLGDRRAEGNSLNSEGVLYGRMGDSERAIARFEQALALARATSSRASELELNNLGVAYKNLGAFDKSLDAYRQALADQRRLGNVDGQALVLNNMGNVLRLLGRHQEALALHLEALKLSRASGGKDNEARSLNTIGEAYAALDDDRKALEYYDQALVIRRQVNDLLGVGASLSAQGRAWRRLGDTEQSLAALGESLALRRRILDRPGEILTLRDLAMTKRVQGQLGDAIVDSRAAVDLEETLRERMTSPELRSSFVAFQHGEYELLIDLLEQQQRVEPSAGYGAEALRVAERARTRVLLDSLLESHVELREGIDPALLERERALQRQLTDVSAQVSRTLARNAAATPGGTEVRLEQLTDDYQRLQSEIRQRSPSYAAVTQHGGLTATEIQRTVVDDDSVLLEFELGDESSWLWAVTPASVDSIQLPARRKIDRLARSLYQGLTSRTRLAGETPTNYAARVRASASALDGEARDLSRMLLGGIADRLNGDWRSKRLVIVADGSLEYLPFAALPVPEPSGDRSRPAALPSDQRPLLVQTHEIVSVPSASVLSALRNQTASRPAASRTLAILADPVFDLADSRVRATLAHGHLSAPPAGSSNSGAPGTLARLSFSREEADSIASLVAPGAVFEATDFNASRTTLLNGRLSDYRLVHFATHGVIDSERPALSGLVLSRVDDRGNPMDGYVRLHDIYNLHLAADLVVLSACQSALGKEFRGEGLVGLARAFMYAGVPRVIGSLWEVSDRATAELMKAFYAGMLQRHLRPAAALRAAQLELARDPRWSSPYYWAGFVLQGDWR